MPIPYIERINEKSIYVRCSCENGFNQPTDKFDPQFLEEFGQYENLTTNPCPNCGMQHAFNLNIPESEYEIEELETEPYFPVGEKKARDSVRDLMWKFRPDLKGKDRAAYAKEKQDAAESHFGKSIAEIRSSLKRVYPERIEIPERPPQARAMDIPKSKKGKADE